MDENFALGNRLDPEERRRRYEIARALKDHHCYGPAHAATMTTTDIVFAAVETLERT